MNTLTTDGINSIQEFNLTDLEAISGGLNATACANSILFWGSVGAGLGSIGGSVGGVGGAFIGFSAGAALGGWFGATRAVCMR